jgi:acetyl esterase/lipase
VTAAAEDDIHPDLRRRARLLPPGPFNHATLPVVRALTRVAAKRVSRDVQVVKLSSGATVRLHRPRLDNGPGAALLWIHGGGYVIGAAAQDDGLCRRFVEQLAVPVVAVDYRLAPRHPYPAALEDCYEALQWMTEHPAIDAGRIAIGGASAGGGLSAALALLARDRARIAPVFQLLVYPMLDDRSSMREDLRRRRFTLWNPKVNDLGWSAYLGDADRSQAVPSRRGDLDGVADAWIGVGTLDPLHDENVDYAARLREAGVQCELEVVPGAFHGFDIVAARSGVAREFFDRQCAALRGAFAA